MTYEAYLFKLLTYPNRIFCWWWLHIFCGLKSLIVLALNASVPATFIVRLALPLLVPVPVHKGLSTTSQKQYCNCCRSSDLLSPKETAAQNFSVLLQHCTTLVSTYCIYVCIWSMRHICSLLLKVQKCRQPLWPLYCRNFSSAFFVFLWLSYLPSYIFNRRVLNRLS